ncbi:DUF87 domain-containing protein [Candidatus Bathyarchaeota archaeon]|nr:DUF87 domain-containing protein [Candidatus Bathyarchaeota archaeon]
MKAPPEKLGSFFLGSEYDLETDQITGEHVNYDARDLTTHAVCIGMTGSGKTGLCICLLEEAALDKVPAIIIDPKGDITNHLLHFPELEASDFQEWVNVDDARRKKLTLEEYSNKVAELWKEGLEKWGIGEKRIRELSDSVDYTIYTPGSSRGISVNILSSLKAPRNKDQDSLNNLITGTTGALLSLMKLNRDPVRSKEGVLISSLLHHYWTREEDLSLEKLIQNVQDPPFNRLGVFDLETFYPSDDRMKLAISMNSIIASPSYSDWLNGDPLNVSKLLYRNDGKPRHSIFSLAHLGDEERMFFVTLLLERLSTWMQGQAGTTSLRALVYFDEMFGFMPPVANPPSKTPLLRLLKQGRAFGLGMVLTTQNPVDLDYKGLTNTGTWFIGKLQTERDKDRLLEGLRSVELGHGKSFDFGKIIGSLDSRVFLLHNVHSEEPIVFHTRWAMNYLRGPLTGPQISNLMKHKKEQVSKLHKDTRHQSEFSNNPPNLDPNIKQYYVRLETDRIQAQEKIVLYPRVLLNYTVRFFNRKRGVDKREKRWVITPEPNDLGLIDWSINKIIDERQINETSPYSDGLLLYDEVPDSFNTLRDLKKIRDDFSDYLYRNETFKIGTLPRMDLFQEQDESRSEFMSRVRQAAREERDAEIDELERKYDSKLDRVNSKIDDLTSDLAAEQDEYKARKREEVFGIGESVLGILLGRRRTTGITTASRRRRMTTKTKHKIEDAKREIEELKEDLKELEDELREQIEEITKKWESVDEEVTDFIVTPRRSDVTVNEPIIAWIFYTTKNI